MIEKFTDTEKEILLKELLEWKKKLNKEREKEEDLKKESQLVQSKLLHLVQMNHQLLIMLRLIELKQNQKDWNH